MAGTQSLHLYLQYSQRHTEFCAVFVFRWCNITLGQNPLNIELLALRASDIGSITAWHIISQF